MASTVWQTAGDGREGSYTAKQVEQDMLHSGLEETPLMVLDSPTDTVADSNLNECVSESMVENVVYIGSYNWVDSAEPIILVPGSPPLWCDRGAPYTLSLDRDMFAFEDAYRVPPSLQNLARMNAIDIMTGENGVHVDWPNIDFITDRNALRKLLGWADGYAGRAFRIDLEFAGERTVFLNQPEEDTQLWVDGRSYGFSFEHESTQPAPGCEGTTGHYRISSYSFGGLQMIVAYEVDACIATTTTLDVPRVSVDVQIQSHCYSKRSAPGSAQASKDNAPMKIIRTGHVVPQTSLIELKASTKIWWMTTYPQLYFGQVPYLYQGIHYHGNVQQIVLRARAEEALLCVEAALQASFRKLRDVLRTIQAFVVEHGHHGHLTLIYEPNHGCHLRVYRRTSQASCLPSETLQRFTRP